MTGGTHAITKKHYAAFIYEHMHHDRHTGIYDVEVVAGDGPLCARSDGRYVVYEIHVSSTRPATVNKLTKYMHWKFPHCQYTGDARRTPVRSRGVFTYLRKNLAWIKSVLKCEFDYHVGVADCLREENEHLMRKYIESQYNGYGLEYCK